MWTKWLIAVEAVLCITEHAAAPLTLTYIAQKDHGQFSLQPWSNVPLRTALLRIGRCWSSMTSSSFPAGEPFPQRTANWDMTDFTKWVLWITLYLPASKYPYVLENWAENWLYHNLTAGLTCKDSAQNCWEWPHMWAGMNPIPIREQAKNFDPLCVSYKN